MISNETTLEFLRDLAELLEKEPDQVAENFKLQGNDAWDSLSVVYTVSLLDRHFHVALHGEEIAACETVGDLLRMAEIRLANQR